MYQDVVDLKAFYQSDLGRTAQRMIRRRIRSFWPDLHGLSLLGLGYATPYLRPFLGEAEQVLAVMPARQGVTRWPADGRSVVALAEEAELPLPDMSVDRVLLVHGLEHAEHLSAVMREAWRVLTGSGRLLAIVPNRRGIWARVDTTPFGHGHPYSASQLRRMLRDNLFVPEREAQALYIPPLRFRFLLPAAPAWEEIGGRWLQRFAGVVVVEASKQLYQPTRTIERARRRRPILVPIGPSAAHPAAHPAAHALRRSVARPGRPLPPAA